VRGSAPKGAKWDIPARFTESKGLRNTLDDGVIIVQLLHHDESLPVPQNER